MPPDPSGRRDGAPGWDEWQTVSKNRDSSKKKSQREPNAVDPAGTSAPGTRFLMSRMLAA